MSVDNFKLWGEVHQDLQNATTNDTSGAVGVSRRGALHVAPWGKPLYNIAEVGQYFLATNPTPGTGVAGIAAADGNNDLENLVHINNESSAGTGKRIYLDYIRLQPTAAGANGTTTTWVAKIDSADRYASGGSEITPVNVNMDSTTASTAEGYFGAVVTSAASSQRVLGHGTIRSVITVVGDSYLFDFGGDKKVPMSGLATAGTAALHAVIPVAPVVLGPGDSFMLQLNAASQSGASSYEFQIGWWEL